MRPLLVFATAVWCATGLNIPPPRQGAPTLLELSPPARRDMPLLSAPVVQNFWGAVSLRHDMVSLGAMALSPYNGNFQNGSFSVDEMPALVVTTRWSACEGLRTGVAGDVAIANAVRMPFEDYAFQQTWTLTAADGDLHALSANLDGPFFRFCDAAGQGACGWGTTFPVDRAHYSSSTEALAGGIQAMLTVDQVTGVAAASAVWFRGGSSANVSSVAVDASNSTFWLQAVFSGPVAQLQQVAAVGNSSAEALQRLSKYLGDALFDAAWQGACTLWEARWQSAFQRPGGPGSHYSGSLPLLTSADPSIDRLYYWAALALVSLERTNYPARPRTFVISQGPSNSLDGSAGMGGSGQFTWDISFAATTLALLDPEHARDIVRFVLAATDVSDIPNGVPQTWDAYPSYGAAPPSLGSYRFDFYAAYALAHVYASIANDTAAVAGALQAGPGAAAGVPGADVLLALATSWLAFPPSVPSPWLRDYGPDKRDYLEVVPTYVDVVPALQFAAVGMSLAQARLYDALGTPGGAPIAAALRANASAIFAAAVAHQWQQGDAGAWRCLYPNGTSKAVRSITDYVYIPQALGLLGRANASFFALPPAVVNASLRFFSSELLSPGTAWVRALSLEDPLCAHWMDANASVEDLLVCRADWGCAGSYGGIPGAAVESAAHLTGALDGTLAALAQLAPVAAAASPSQGIALGTPTYFALHWNGDHAPDDVPAPPFSSGFPEYFDEKDFPLFWPSTERYIQNAEASLCDAVIRTVFGWRPDWVTPNAPRGSPAAAAAIDAALFLPGAPRSGFAGRLDFVRTPLGYINITADAQGIAWAWVD